MSLTNKQALWFDSLPTKSIDDGFEKTCPCGKTFWFTHQATSQQSIESWIVIHFEHIHIVNELTAPATVKKTEFSLFDLYDFSRHVSFSVEGYKLFIKKYQLKHIAIVEDDIDIFIDVKGNKFAFYEDTCMQHPELGYHLHPEYTEVQTDYVAR